MFDHQPSHVASPAPAGTGGATAPGLTDEAAAELSNQLVLTVKLLVHARDQLKPATAHHGVDAPAYPLLFLLAHGPRRVSDLAEAVHSDVSTVSRHTTALGRAGLVDKVCSPDDRRVQLVTITDAGRAFMEERTAERRAWFGRVLADWDPAEIDAFRAHLERFAADVERVVRH